MQTVKNNPSQNSLSTNAMASPGHLMHQLEKQDSFVDLRIHPDFWNFSLFQSLVKSELLQRVLLLWHERTLPVQLSWQHYLLVNHPIGARMKRLIIEASIVATVLSTFGFTATTATAQMGLRENDLFASHAFANVGPAVGSLVPELDLTDLDGNSVTLESYRGQVVVLVKGGYT